MGELELFLGAIASIGFLITGLWIFDSMTISVMQRTREFGVMKAMGFGNREIFLMLVVEIAMLSLMGAAGGLGGACGIDARGVPLHTGRQLQDNAGAIPPHGDSYNCSPARRHKHIGCIGAGVQAARIPPAQTLRYE